MQRKQIDWVSVLVTLLMLGWVIGATGVIQLTAWVFTASPGQFLQRSDVSAAQIYFNAAVVQAIVLLLPLVPLALWWRAPRYRRIWRAWLAATFFLLLLAPARLVPSPMPQPAMLLQCVLALLFCGALWFITGRGRIFARASAVGVALALSVGILLALPWLVWGALGSLSDVVLGILNAGALALAVTLIVTRVWQRELSGDAREAEGETDASAPSDTRQVMRGQDVAVGGFVLGALLLVMASASGFSGTQILFMLALSACGWLLLDILHVGLHATNTWNDGAFFVVTVLVVGAPMLLLDPDTGVLLASAGEGEMLGYAFQATGMVVLGAWVLGIVLFLARKAIAQWRRASLAWLGAGVMAVLALVLYWTQGQPGFFGDRVFVILKNQANVSSAKNIADDDARRAFVYNTLTQHANETQTDLRETLDALRISYTPYYLVNALEVEANLFVQWWLTTRSDVDRVLASPRMRPLPEPLALSRGARTSVPLSPEWNLTLIGANRVWNELGVRGADVIVGQSDSGVDGTHPEFAAQYRGLDGNHNYNWFDPWNHSLAPQDFGGHGTHTLGSILGKNVGVAPDATWIGCVNLARNLGNPALYLDCMQFHFAPFPQNGNPLRDGKPNLGAMVLNNSWGCPDVEGCDANALLNAVRALRDAGVFVVASAGNDGPACSSINAPLSLYDDVFSVGAINENKQLADFSSRGPVTADASGRVKPDIAAPGVAVYSAMPGGTYGTSSGTSMAGPHIVGVVALMWSANPNLIGDIDTTEQILRETAQRVDIASEKIVCGDPNATPNDFVGYGIVDAYAAVKRAREEK